MPAEILAFNEARASRPGRPITVALGLRMSAKRETILMSKREGNPIPADLVGHDPEQAKLIGQLSEDLAPGEDPLFIDLARREADKPPPNPMHEIEAPVYVDPKTPPERTKTKTLELETVRVDAPAPDDPRRMPTQREIPIPRESDADESEARRVPTLRKLRKPPAPEAASTLGPISPPIRKSSTAVWIVGVVVVVAIVVAVTMARKPTSEVSTEQTATTTIVEPPSPSSPPTTSEAPPTATTAAAPPSTTTTEPRKLAPSTSRPAPSSTPVATSLTAPPPTRAPGAVSLDPKVPF